MSFQTVLLALARYNLNLDRKYGTAKIMVSASGDFTLVIQGDEFEIKQVASLGNSFDMAVERLNVMSDNIKLNKKLREEREAAELNK